eukprot:8863057-Pyramimonas_sp.AAC.1
MKWPPRRPPWQHQSLLQWGLADCASLSLATIDLSSRSFASTAFLSFFASEAERRSAATNMEGAPEPLDLGPK